MFGDTDILDCYSIDFSGVLIFPEQKKKNWGDLKYKVEYIST